MENIFERENASFHGIRSYDFTKLSDILEKGILPQKMLPEEKTNSKLGEKHSHKVFVTISPNILGKHKSRAYNWYVENSFGIVIDHILENEMINRSFPDSGYIVGPIPAELFIGITIPKEIYEATIDEIKETQSFRLKVEDKYNRPGILVSDIIDEYNINKLPVYDSRTGQLLKKYILQETNNKQR